MEGYLASIDAARDAVFQYIALESRWNAQRSAMLAARRVVAEPPSLAEGGRLWRSLGRSRRRS